MQALGFLLSAMPDEEIPEKLLSLVSPHIQDLKQLANQAVRIKQHKSRQTGRNYTFRKSLKLLLNFFVMAQIFQKKKKKKT